MANVGTAPATAPMGAIRLSFTVTDWLINIVDYNFRLYIWRAQDGGLYIGAAHHPYIMTPANPENEDPILFITFSSFSKKLNLTGPLMFARRA